MVPNLVAGSVRKSNGKCLHRRKMGMLLDPSGTKSMDVSHFLEKHLQHCADCQVSFSAYQEQLRLVENQIPRPICPNEVLHCLYSEVEELLSGIALVEQLEHQKRPQQRRAIFWQEYGRALLSTLLSKEMLGLGLGFSVLMVCYAFL